MNTVERFSNRVENYIKYRPDYPREIVGYLAEKCGLTTDSVVADIGCGTGISSRMFLENGNPVFGVEPNEAMRKAAAGLLSEFTNFTAVDGTAENTTLQESSIDIVTAAQAFHWFDPEKTRAEFARILRPGGLIVLLWNERQLEATPFLAEYETFLLKYAHDYSSVRHDKIDVRELADFFRCDFTASTFPNLQVFDLAGLTGRMLSSSYMPAENDAVYPAMIDELRNLFAKHNENGRIKVFYDTNVFWFRI